MKPHGAVFKMTIPDTLGILTFLYIKDLTTRCSILK